MSIDRSHIMTAFQNSKFKIYDFTLQFFVSARHQSSPIRGTRVTGLVDHRLLTVDMIVDFITRRITSMRDAWYCCLLSRYRTTHCSTRLILPRMPCIWPFAFCLCLLSLSFAFLSFVLFPYLRSSDRVNLKTQTVSRR